MWDAFLVMEKGLRIFPEIHQIHVKYAYHLYFSIVHCFTFLEIKFLSRHD